MGSISTTFQELVSELPEPDMLTPSLQRTLSASLDPRSPPPCELGSRTPIHVVKTPDMLGDPRSPTVGIVRTPIRGGPHPPVAESDAVSVKEESVVESPDVFIKAIVAEDAKSDIKLITGDSPVLTTTVTTPSVAPREAVCLVKVSRCKTLFSASSPSNPPRSPLGCRSNAVTDSPRSMVQRKQVDKMMGHRKRSSQRYEECDKENMMSPLART